MTQEQMADVEEWQFREMAKKQTTQIEQIKNVLDVKFDEYQSGAESAAEFNAVPVHERILGSDVGAGVDNVELQQRILRATKAAAGPERLSMDSLTEES
jgi:chromosome condensin MukBEF MukE localization factor